MKKIVFSRWMGAGLGALLLGQGMAGALPRTTLAQAGEEWYNCMTREVFTPEKQAWCDRLNLALNASYSVPTLGEQPQVGVITFENGRFEDPNRRLNAVLSRQQGQIAFGDLDGNGQQDAVMIMAVNTGGSGIFVYLAPLLNLEGAIESPMLAGLGDRIQVNRVRLLDDGLISVNLIIQGPNDPQCCPTQEVTQFYRVSEGSVVQVPPPGETLPASPGTPALPDGATLSFFQTPGYAVRLFSRNGAMRLNLFNRKTGRLELSGVPTTAAIDPDGIAYTYNGTPSVKVYRGNLGTQSLTVNGMVQESSLVTGTVTYLPRIALPPNALIEVSLADVSRADAPARILATQTIESGGRQVPFAFELPYDPAQIDSRYSYAVQARITVDGQLRFINTTRTSVITNGSPTQGVEIVVNPVQR
ncbi:MAG: YbaY family lipoprotein [Cyanobacteriota bacterium]